MDFVMSGLVMTPNRARVVRYSVPYMDITAAFAVPDYLRQEFANATQFAVVVAMDPSPSTLHGYVDTRDAARYSATVRDLDIALTLNG